MMSSAVEASGLRVVRGGREVLHSLDFRIPQGSIVGLLGPSGCGKTTLMRAIVGVQIVTDGKVTVLGHPAGSPPLRHRVGYSTQEPAVYADLTVIENMRYFASVLRAPRGDAERVIGEVGLDKQAGQVVSTPSRGQLSPARLAFVRLIEEKEAIEV